MAAAPKACVEKGKILTLTIITERHLGLPKPDGVFARADAIELFQLGLANILRFRTVSDVGARGSRACPDAKGDRKHAPGWGYKWRCP
jgi:hypothetical protein